MGDYIGPVEDRFDLHNLFFSEMILVWYDIRGGVFHRTRAELELHDLAAFSQE